MSLTQKEYGNLRNLYSSVYTSSEVEITEEVTEELIDEVVDELVEELVTEGYDEEEAYSLVEEATDAYIDEAKVTFGHDTTARRASGAPVGAKRRYGMRKAGEALSGAKKAVGGAVDSAKKKASAVKAGAQIAGSIAKDEVRRAGRKAQHSASKAASAVKSAPGKAKDKAKKGIKGFIKRQAEKVVKRMSEGYDEPKMHSAVKRVMTTQPAAKGRAASRLHSKYSMRSKGNVAGETDGPGPNAPKRSGRKGRGSETDRGSGNAAKRRMSEEIEALKESGLFSDKEIEAFISKEGDIAEMGNPSFDIRGGDARKAAKTQKINKAADAGVPNAAGKAKGPILPGNLKGV